ncbi:hypothetical protein HK102_007050, partial [Quaeritorhiza haematococci]
DTQMQHSADGVPGWHTGDESSPLPSYSGHSRHNSSTSSISVERTASFDEVALRALELSLQLSGCNSLRDRALSHIVANFERIFKGRAFVEMVGTELYNIVVERVGRTLAEQKEALGRARDIGLNMSMLRQIANSTMNP